MNSDRKKELLNAYKTKPVIGGICLIRCSGNGRYWLQATKSIEGLKNRFNFAMSTKTSPDPSMRNEWAEFGSSSFSFSVLDEVKKGETQTDSEFSDDIDALYEIWQEKSENGEL